MSFVPMKPITAPAADLEDHSPIGFSGWDRHSACHGSVALASLCPPGETSVHADLGLVAHAAAAYWLISGKAQKGLDAAMEDYIRHYVYTVWDCLPKQALEKVIWMVEGRVAAPSIHAECRGTVDSLIWDPATKVLQIHDLKYGKWPVTAERNQQLMGYAVCAREQFKLKPKHVELYIHQVRLRKEPDMWGCDDMELDFFEEEVREHVAAIEKQRAILRKTKDPRKLDLHAGDHCKFCPAWSRCHERENAARDEGLSMLVPKPAVLPEDAARAVAFAMKAAPWARMVLAKAREHMIQGGTLPGFKLVAGKRSRVAVDPESFVDELTLEADLGGLGLDPKDVYTQPRVKSINQIGEVIPEDKQKAFGALWRWQAGAPQLVVEEDKRPPLRIRPEDYFTAIEAGEDPDETE